MRMIGYLLGLGLTCIMILGIIVGLYLWRLNKQLPSYDHLSNYVPSIMTRIHASDGGLIAEFAQEYRIFVPIEVIPQKLIEAFLSAEDKNYYEHYGVDTVGITRAMLNNIFNFLSGKRLEGASTITQQVAKNFLLTNDVTFERKLKEAVLAVRLERTFSKEELLGLYLNEIYLGVGTYGVASAALNYFDKSLDQLTLAEMAYLAILPKAPNNYHPTHAHDRAVARRNWVLERMLKNNYITEKEAQQAQKEKLISIPRRKFVRSVEAAYFIEAVRREVYDMYGNKVLYGGGLSVRSTLNTDYQKIALRTLRNGLVVYDQRHGWRGAVQKINLEENDWVSSITKIPIPRDLAPWRLAVVLEANETQARIGIRPRQKSYSQFDTIRELGVVTLTGVRWARKKLKKGRGTNIKQVTEVLSVGDVIWVEKSGEEYVLKQIPEVNGALIAIDPHTGRVLAMVGGYSFDLSEFNRTTQANRQPGSAFKPFVYAVALDKGYTPVSRVLDGPFVMEQGQGLGFWKPENYGKKFYGMSTLRLGIERSRNLMTVRLAQQLGMQHISEYARKFNIMNHMPPVLSMALGAGETTLLRLTLAYAMLVNGGKKITPTLIDRIQNRYGKTIYRYDNRICETCNDVWHGQNAPQLSDIREQILTPQTAYQMVSMLEGVIKRGTGHLVNEVGKTLAGKTGTTNDERDAWFIGFSPDLTVGVYIGFDTPQSLGKKETGGRVAAPVFKEFMKNVLQDSMTIPFRIPPLVNLVRVNAITGELAKPSDRSVILEAFKIGTEPVFNDKKMTKSNRKKNDDLSILTSGTGGIY